MDVLAVVSALRSEQARAQGIVDACVAALAIFEPQLPRTTAKERIDRVVRRYKPRQPKATPPRVPQIAPPQTGPVDSKVGRYRAAILAFLRRDDTPNHCADSTVIRRQIAKACAVDPLKDKQFTQDVGNALYSLKSSGQLERSGNVWALTEKGKAA